MQFTNTATEYIMSYGNFGNSLTGTPAGVGYSGFRLAAAGSGAGAARLTAALYDTNGGTGSSISLSTTNSSVGYLQSNTWYHLAVVFTQNASVANGTNLQILREWRGVGVQQYHHV